MKYEYNRINEITIEQGTIIGATIKTFEHTSLGTPISHTDVDITGVDMKTKEIVTVREGRIPFDDIRQIIIPRKYAEDVEKTMIEAIEYVSENEMDDDDRDYASGAQFVLTSICNNFEIDEYDVDRLFGVTQ